MARKRKANLRQQFRNAIHKQYVEGQGQSRHDLKADDEAQYYVTSNNTFRVYKERLEKFAEWMGEVHPDVKTMKDARKYVGDFLEGLKSTRKPLTVKNYACALGKVFKCQINDFGVDFEPCRRADVTNNRGQKESHKHINESNYRQACDLIDNCGARHSELVKADIFSKEHGIIAIFPDYVVIRGKGGKERKAEWMGTEDELNAFLHDWIKCPVGEQVYPAPKALPTHRHRQTYAKRVYEKYARPLDALPKEEKYFCRHELKGLVFDRQALLKVQQNIGHNDLHCVTRYKFN